MPSGHFLADTLAEAGIDVGPLRFFQRGAHRAGFRLVAIGWRTGIHVLPPSQRRHAIHASGSGHGRDQPRQAFALRFDQPDRRTVAQRHAVRGRRGPRGRGLVSYDPNLRLPLWPDADAARKGMLLGLSKAHIVKLSDNESEFLTGLSDLKAARQALWHEDLKLMVVTRGRAGCVYFTPNFTGMVESFTVEAVDATGAGDGFVAGLLQGLLADPSTFQDETRLREAMPFRQRGRRIGDD